MHCIVEGQSVALCPLRLPRKSGVATSPVNGGGTVGGTPVIASAAAYPEDRLDRGVAVESNRWLAFPMAVG
jgi:hypothetical protein